MFKAVAAAVVLAFLLILAMAEIFDRSSTIKVLNSELMAQKATVEKLRVSLEAREEERAEVVKRFADISRGIEELKQNDEKILEWANSPIPDGVISFMRENKPVW